MQWLELKLPPVLLWLVFAATAWWGAALAPWGPMLPGGLRMWLAGLLALLGASAGIGGVLAFHHHKTTHSPMAPERATKVVQTGLYRFSRNPMYLGLALLLAAWVMALGAPVALLAVPAFMATLTRLQIQPEERILAAKFGAEYQAYLASVRRWL